MITWIKRKNGNVSPVRGVKLSVIKSGAGKNGQRYAVRISIAPDKVKRISKTGYVAIGHDPDTNRVFFRESDSRSGHKITQHSTTNEVRFTPDDIEYWKRYEGSHEIKHDKLSDMYYFEVRT